MNLDIYLLTTSDKQYPLLQLTSLLHSGRLGARSRAFWCLECCWFVSYSQTDIEIEEQIDGSNSVLLAS